MKLFVGNIAIYLGSIHEVFVVSVLQRRTHQGCWQKAKIAQIIQEAQIFGDSESLLLVR